MNITLQPVGVAASDYDGLIEALRARKSDLQLTDTALEELAGLTAGHVGKLLGDLRAKILGPVTLPLILQALAVKIVLVHDAEAAAKMEQRWERRERPAVNTNRLARLGQTTLRRVFPVVLSEQGKRAAACRMTKMTPAARSRVARQAARARWAKKRGPQRDRG
jgi:hypothetical protein